MWYPDFSSPGQYLAGTTLASRQDRGIEGVLVTNARRAFVSSLLFFPLFFSFFPSRLFFIFIF